MRISSDSGWWNLESSIFRRKSSEKRWSRFLSMPFFYTMTGCWLRSTTRMVLKPSALRMPWLLLKQWEIVRICPALLDHKKSHDEPFINAVLSWLYLMHKCSKNAGLCVFCALLAQKCWQNRQSWTVNFVQLYTVQQGRKVLYCLWGRIGIL